MQRNFNQGQEGEQTDGIVARFDCFTIPVKFMRLLMIMIEMMMMMIMMTMIMVVVMLMTIRMTIIISIW